MFVKPHYVAIIDHLAVIFLFQNTTGTHFSASDSSQTSGWTHFSSASNQHKP